MAESVTIRNLKKTFPGNVRAMDDVSLDIAAGELFFLLGPSGCGKTTLLRSIAGFVTPDAGTIHIGARDVSRLPAHKRDTGMVFQSYALWPHLTIRQNVAFGLEMRGWSRKATATAAMEALERVQMQEKADAKPNELSGGQQQRIALARALVVAPECLLLDEPLSNLDARLRLDMRQEIRRICKTAGITAIYVTHDQKEALSIADRMAILAHGRVQQVGTPQEIYRRPATAFVAGFIGESNFLEGVAKACKGDMVGVETSLGMVYARADRLPEIGCGVTLSIRPEAVHKADDMPVDTPNRFPAACRQVVYLGESAQYLLDSNGTSLKRHAWNPDAVDRVGQQEWIRFDPGDVVVLQDAL
jgi:iron(III) transport system ATP-binding protein